ncbi:ribosome small subunit-dependent GTPase A [Dysgonomonas sp. GY617]|uniref:ribosome small subunit-dependent GTPase A n=1 Tax=Dysgonomonas sp. GY617 TaxID=2780420 RepID=UPI00188352CC|nr:ribosome small subunit-dependent GTPase A [Dysgonomonas sp. GY617]MBF0577780.1 ribosome small subunit-dependent GTPase A [Dysgonomonas sp. GY617]
MRGLVIKNTGSWYLVRTDENKDVECKIRGSFRLKDIRSTNPITVGDRVSIVMNEDNTGVITEIETRKNYIIRRSSNLSKQSHIIASNLDLCFLIVTVSKPVTTTVFIDRFLASAEAYRIPVNLLFNKIDICDEEEIEYMEALINLYEYIGYPCFKISARNSTGLDILNDKLKDQITLFSGHSGVGKSTLINAIVPNATLRTGDISNYHGKGMHTTTFSEMLELPQGGFIIDTPGIKGFGTVDMSPEEISHYFPEIFKFSHNCRFNNCMHTNEPGCAVREAVENHYISETRYKSYINILEDETNDKYRK